jgi:hypothetical protein
MMLAVTPLLHFLSILTLHSPSRLPTTHLLRLPLTNPLFCSNSFPCILTPLPTPPLSTKTQPIIYASAEFLKLTGFDVGEVIGRNCSFLQGPETNRDEVQFTQSHLVLPSLCFRLACALRSITFALRCSTFALLSLCFRSSFALHSLCIRFTSCFTFRFAFAPRLQYFLLSLCVCIRLTFALHSLCIRFAFASPIIFRFTVFFAFAPCKLYIRSAFTLRLHWLDIRFAFSSLPFFHLSHSIPSATHTTASTTHKSHTNHNLNLNLCRNLTGVQDSHRPHRGP